MTPLVIWTLVLVIYFLPTIVSGRFDGFASYLIATGGSGGKQQAATYLRHQVR